MATIRDREFWIEGRISRRAQHPTGPLVIGARWLLEAVRSERTRRTLGLFWASYSIIGAVDELSDRYPLEFVGIALPSEPPASWLTTSMVFEFGDIPLPRTSEHLIALVEKPLPYRCIEAGEHASRLSRDAKRLIAKTYRGDTPISVIAAGLGVSHAHLARQFKRDFGLPPIAYRNRLRVSDAMAGLSEGQDILAVGYEVGFNDTSRFYDDFRKVTGTSPGKCRL